MLEVGSLETASAPQIIGDRLVFSYTFRDGPELRGTNRVHSVEIAFAHENYSILRPFARNEQDVYVYLHPLEPGREEYRYRLVVDGIWIADPLNPDRIRDRWGVTVSRTTISLPERTALATPIVRAANDVEFVLRAPEGSRVNVVGSFNGWDPFMTELRESEPGIYSRRLRLGPGEHLYYYVVDGLRLPDPQNSERRWHVSGMTVSVLSLP